MISKFMKYFKYYAITLFLFTYILGWYDLINNNMLSGNIFSDVVKSFTYYAKYVFMYWVVMILVISTVLSFLTLGVMKIKHKNS